MSVRGFRYLPLGLLGLLGLCLVGCASQPKQAAAPLPGKNACFWTSTIYDWTVINDSTILVHAPSPRDAYLVKLFYPIPGLTLDQVSLGFQGGDGEPGQFCRENGYVISPGPVREREAIVKEKPTSMQACIDCHKAKGAATGCRTCHDTV